MTNSYNDIRSQDHDHHGRQSGRRIGISLQLLEGKELNRANYIVIERLTRTAAHATDFVRIRSGTDIAVIWGMLWHIFKNGWEDKEFIKQRASTAWTTSVRKVEKWTPAEVENVTGVPEAQLKRVAETFAEAETRHVDLVYGRDPAHRRHRQRARVLPRCSLPPAMLAASATAPASSAAIAASGRDRSRLDI